MPDPLLFRPVRPPTPEQRPALVDQAIEQLSLRGRPFSLADVAERSRCPRRDAETGVARWIKSGRLDPDPEIQRHIAEELDQRGWVTEANVGRVTGCGWYVASAVLQRARALGDLELGLQGRFRKPGTEPVQQEPPGPGCAIFVAR